MTKTNKKGFTLIELIIVIAILAILIAALSPLLIKWIERSRVSKDKSSLDNVYVAINTALAKENIAGTDTDAKWTKLSTLTSGDLYDEIFGADDATIDAKYASDDADVLKTVFVSNDASGKVVWYAITDAGKVAVCLAPEDCDADTKIATEIGVVGSAAASDCSWS